jgi:hypothetical protein
MSCLMIGLCLLGLATGPSDLGSPAEELRSRDIAKTIRALEAERDQNGGDWTKWHESLAPFRASLRARIGAAKARYAEQTHAASVRGPVLEPLGDPPLFTCLFFSEMGHLGPEGEIERWVAERPVLETVPAVSSWLHKKGIDLVFVPVPLMGDVYPELLAEQAPANRLVAPAIRRVLHELARRGVEVADALTVLLDARAEGGKALYRPADPHWAPRGQRVMAEALAKRLERYSFVAKTRALPARYRIRRMDLRFPGVSYEALSSEQKTRIEPLLRAGTPVVVADPWPLTSDDAPVVVIGDSFADGFRDYLAASLNQPIFNMSAGGQVSQGVIDLVRDPSLLVGRRVVVWVSNTGEVGLFDKRWKIPQLP